MLILHTLFSLRPKIFPKKNQQVPFRVRLYVMGLKVYAYLYQHSALRIEWHLPTGCMHFCRRNLQLEEHLHFAHIQFAISTSTDIKNANIFDVPSRNLLTRSLDLVDRFEFEQNDVQEKQQLEQPTPSAPPSNTNKSKRKIHIVDTIPTTPIITPTTQSKPVQLEKPHVIQRNGFTEDSDF